MTLAFRPGQHHGGWNSDDNQTNNIGRFRISVTDAAAASGRRAPAGGQGRAGLGFPG